MFLTVKDTVMQCLSDYELKFVLNYQLTWTGMDGFADFIES